MNYRKINSIIESAKNHATTWQAKAALEDLWTATDYSEPGYSQPESKLIVFANWNNVRHWDKSSNQSDDDTIMPRLGNVLEKRYGAELTGPMSGHHAAIAAKQSVLNLTPTRGHPRSSSMIVRSYALIASIQMIIWPDWKATIIKHSQSTPLIQPIMTMFCWKENSSPASTQDKMLTHAL